MAYYDYDFDENTLSVFKGRKFAQAEIINRTVTIEGFSEYFHVLCEGEEFAGVKFLNVYEQNECLGKWGEDAFRNLLNSKNIPAMFIGQNPLGMESLGQSPTKLKRPDFLVNPPHKGSILVDVKVRSDLGTDYFVCAQKDLAELAHLSSEVHLPVWLAFIGADQLKKPVEDMQWFLSPVKSLSAFADRFLEKVNDMGIEPTKDFVRIPKSLFTPLKDELYFDTPTEISDQQVTESVEFYVNCLVSAKELVDKKMKELETKKAVKAWLSTVIIEDKNRFSLYKMEIEQLI